MSASGQYIQPRLIASGDPIFQLPVDQTPPLPNELHIVDTLFKKHRKTMDVIFEEAKYSIFVALLVMIACLPNVDLIINKMLPATQNVLYFSLLAKGVVAGIIYWIVKHFYLSQKPNM